MQFIQTPLKDAFIIEVTPFQDERGYFFRSFCEKEFAENGLPSSFPQCNFSYNYQKGTLRGLHFQHPPLAEGKLVRAIEGKIFDVIIDLRKESPTYLQHISVELSKENKKSLFVPAGFAHGFQCLEDNSTVFYQMTNFYDANYQDGIHWNDPTLAIQWPIEKKIISERDNNFGYVETYSS